MPDFQRRTEWPPVIRPVEVVEKPGDAFLSLPRIDGMDDHDEEEENVRPGSSTQFTWKAPNQPQRAAERVPQRSSPSQPISSSLPSRSPSTSTSFRPVNASSAKKSATKKAKAAVVDRLLVTLAPAPSRPPTQLSPRQLAPQLELPQSHEKGFYSIPAEIRVEIYKMVLANTTVHISPRGAKQDKEQHLIARLSKTIRNEVLPIIHATCPITAVVNDFDFSSILEFMARIPPNDQKALTKNKSLTITLTTTDVKTKGPQRAVKDSASLRTWLHARADNHRLQPNWKYTGAWPGRKVESDLRRRIKRMPEEGKKQEMLKLGAGIGLQRMEGEPRP